MFLQIKKAGERWGGGDWASQDFRWTGCSSLWSSPDFCLQAQQQISEYHNCKKDLKEASGTSLPCKEEGEGSDSSKGLQKMSQKLAYHDLDEGPRFCFFCLILIFMREV